MKKFISIKNDKDLNKFYKKLFLYRGFLFSPFKFETDYDDIIPVINALNIKNKYERIDYIYKYSLDYLDSYYKKLNPNICSFCNNKCIVERINNYNHTNGCCRACIYQSTSGCKTRNLTCKLFYCTRVREKYKTYNYDNFYIIKCLDLRRQFILKEDYFTNEDDAILDLKIGLLFFVTFKIVIRDIINFIRLYKKKKNNAWKEKLYEW